MLQRTRGKVTRDSNCALVKQLLTAGGDVNGKDSQGFPPLTIVAWRGHTEEAQLILKTQTPPRAKQADRKMETGADKHGFSGDMYMRRWWRLEGGYSFKPNESPPTVRSTRTRR